MTATMSDPISQAAAKPSAAISFSEKFAFVVVSRKRPAFSIRVDGLQVTCDGQSLDEDMAKNQVRLLPDLWEKRLNAAYGAVVRVAEKRTLPFELGTVNVRVLARSSQTEFWAEVAAARLNLASEIEEFLAAYDNDVLAWNRERWTKFMSEEDYYAKIGCKLPTRAQLADPAKRRLGVYVFSVGIGEDFIHTQSAEDMESAATEAVLSGRKELKSSIEGCVGALRGRIQKAVESLAEQLNTGARLSVDSLKETHDAIVLARSFADMADPTLLVELSRMEKQLMAATNAAEAATGKKGDTQTAALMAHKNGLLSAIGQLEAACTNPTGVRQVLQSRFGAAPRLLNTQHRAKSK